MQLLAPAKINLQLRVGARGENGFHPLSSWMCTVGLFDTIRVETATRADGPVVELTCDDPSLPTDGRNLIVRAAEALARKIGTDGEARSNPRRASAAHTQPARVTIDLQKKIPAGGGLGGGSSNAARVLLGLSRLWEMNLSPRQLLPIAAEVGSDVPFFLFGSSSICTGRGEIVKPIAAPAAKFCVLILPKFSTSTADVYRRFDEMKMNGLNGDDAWSESAFNDSWSAMSSESLLPPLVNDLEAPAFSLHPNLRELQASAQQLLGRAVRMSGSGSTLFTLFDQKDAADRAAESLAGALGIRTVAAGLAPTISDDL